MTMVSVLATLVACPTVAPWRKHLVQYRKSAKASPKELIHEYDPKDGWEYRVYQTEELEEKCIAGRMHLSEDRLKS